MQRSLDAPVPTTADLAVVGAGIVGLATARELQRRHPGASIAVLDRERRLAAHQSGHSSGVIHAGIYYRPGSLKARLCVEGARRLYEFCAAHGIEARRDGKLIVATRRRELPRLAELERRGRANDVPGLRRLEGTTQIRSVEPHAAGIVALHSPATGVVDFAAVAAALAAELAGRGATLAGGCEVLGIREREGTVELRHRGGTLRAARAVICAGPWADRLAVAAGGPGDPRIVPFRGTYLRLRPERSHLVRASIYPVPDPALPFLGVHLTRGPGGEVLLGPTALLGAGRELAGPRRGAARDLLASLSWPGTWRLFRRYWRAGARELAHAASRRALLAECRRFVPELRASDVVASPHNGIRAQAVGRDGSLVDDFVVGTGRHTVHVRNAPSPAATASLALAEEIADRLEGLS
jgi:(S)-2-hydroxyglutarate dehydrogenase